MRKPGVAVVTGGGSGIGRETCARLASLGWRVYELSRRDNPAENVTHIPCDVTDPASVAAAFQRVEEREGRLDLLVNNAGGGISGAAEFTELSEAKNLFDVNFFGTLTCVQAALPLLRASEGGRIVNLSSVAAALPIPFQAFYSASKAAINALTLALANELRPFGVSVTALLPGDASTGFTDARHKDERGDELYGGRIRKSVAAMERDERGGMSAGYVARRVVSVACRRRVKPLYGVGGKYRLFLVLAKLLPARLSNRIVGALYS